MKSKNHRNPTANPSGVFYFNSKSSKQKNAVETKKIKIRGKPLFPVNAARQYGFETMGGKVCLVSRSSGKNFSDP